MPTVRIPKKAKPSYVQDPVLRELLLAHIEPRMKELLRLCGYDSDGTRKITTLNFYPEDPYRRYHLIVQFHSNGGSFYFDVLNDGGVRA